MEESREGEGGIKSQQRITMDNQHSVRPQPFPYQKKKKKKVPANKNLWLKVNGGSRSGVSREHVTSGFWWLTASCVNIH